MHFYTADFLIAFAALGSAIAGVFIGFSGALAFLAASLAAAAGGHYGWVWSADFLANGWARALFTLVVVLVGFGLVRYLVAKLVNGLLRQPADGIFGFVVAGLTGAALAIGMVYFINFTEIVKIDSVLVSRAVAFVGG